MVDKFIEYYEYILQKATGNGGTSIKKDNKNIKLVSNLLDRLDSLYKGSYGDRFLFDYIIFQFKHYEGMKLRFGDNNIQLNWITGEKALERWENRDVSRDSYFSSVYCNKYGIKQPSEIKVNEEGRIAYLNRERARFVSVRERQLLHCMENFLFTDDTICQNCNFYKKCKDGSN
jgi:hypothetical protein